MSSIVYNSFKRDLMKAGFDLVQSTIRVMLVTSSYVASSTHTQKGDVTNEVSGTGYTANGASLSGATVGVVTTTSRAFFTGNAVTWPSSTITARGAVIYAQAGTLSQSPLIAYVNFGSDKTSSSGNFTINWSSDGIINIS